MRHSLGGVVHSHVLFPVSYDAWTSYKMYRPGKDAASQGQPILRDRKGPCQELTFQLQTNQSLAHNPQPFSLTTPPTTKILFPFSKSFLNW